MAREEHWTLFRNGFLIWSGFEPTQDGGGPRVGMVGEGGGGRGDLNHSIGRGGRGSHVDSWDKGGDAKVIEG